MGIWEDEAFRAVTARVMKSIGLAGVTIPQKKSAGESEHYSIILHDVSLGRSIRTLIQRLRDPCEARKNACGTEVSSESSNAPGWCRIAVHARGGPARLGYTSLCKISKQKSFRCPESEAKSKVLMEYAANVMV